MEDNFIMSTSVMQYLDDIQSYMKEKHPLITGDNYDINSDGKNDDDEENKEGDPDSVEQAGSSEVNLNDLEHQDQLSLFNSKLSIRDESDEDLDMVPESTLAEVDIPKDDDTIKTTQTKSDSSLKESKPDEEEPKFKKPKMTNKERARNARQRKKQYYEDLEKRAEYLEKKVVQLNSELDYCKRKLKCYESQGTSVCESKERPIQKCQINNCVKMIKSIPDCKGLLDFCNKKEESFGPFGSEKVKILENSFNSILENMLCCGNKLLLYAVEKDLPKSKADYERYDKLKKFKRHEIYPDPLVRRFIETNIELNLSTDQFLNLYINQIPQLIEIKNEMKIGMNMLFEAKQQIYKSLMLNHVFKKKFMNPTICKTQLIHTLNDMKDFDLKVSYEQIFNVQKEDVQIERSIDIIDPEIYAKVTSCDCEIDPSTLPKAFSDTFHMTVQRCV